MFLHITVDFERFPETNESIRTECLERETVEVSKNVTESNPRIPSKGVHRSKRRSKETVQEVDLSEKMTPNSEENHLFVYEKGDDITDSKFESELKELEKVMKQKTNSTSDNEQSIQRTRTFTGVPRRKPLRYAFKAKSRKLELEEQQKDPLVMEAMRNEINDLSQRGAIEIVDLLEDDVEITSTWVHKYKTDANNQFLRVKSRICPHGFKQIEGLHYDKKRVASPTAHLPDVLLFLAITCQEKMHLRHYDVKSAFSIPELKERIVIKFPVGMNKMKGKTVLLKNSLNGLNAARAGSGHIYIYN